MKGIRFTAHFHKKSYLRWPKVAFLSCTDISAKKTINDVFEEITAFFNAIISVIAPVSLYFTVLKMLVEKRRIFLKKMQK